MVQVILGYINSLSAHSVRENFESIAGSRTYKTSKIAGPASWLHVLIMQYSSLQNNTILNTAIPSITCAPLQTQLADTFTIYSYAHSQCFAVLCCDYIISMG